MLRKKQEYVLACPTKTGCVIKEIRVLLFPELLDTFGFNCPFCQAQMINRGKAPSYLTCYLCEEDNGGHCYLSDNEKKIEDLNMPTCCPYGLNVYADFTRECGKWEVL
jgi:hypothetical protein